MLLLRLIGLMKSPSYAVIYEVDKRFRIELETDFWISS